MNSLENLSSQGKTYKISFGWKLLILILVLPPTSAFIYLGIIPFTTPHKNIYSIVFFLFISVSLTAVIIIGVIYTFIYRITIFDHSIVQRNLLSEVKIDFSEIIGFRVIPNRGIILYTNSKKRKIELSIYMEKKDEIIDWVSENFKSFDDEEIQEDAIDIIKDAKNDDEQEEIIKKFDIATRIMRILNFLSVVTALWAFIIPRPYEIAIIANAAFPMIALLFMVKYKGIVSFEEYKNSIRPSVGPMAILPALAIALRAFLDFQIIYSKLFWAYWIAISLFFIGIFVIVTLKSNEHKKHKGVLILIAIMLITYSYGVMLHANCLFDSSQPKRYKTTIVDKKISGGKTTSYYLKVTSWGKFETETKISVSKSLFSSVIKGNEVYIYEMGGNLGIKWFVAMDE
ncbi:MAG: hypothetical protein N2645_06940 [Clostridia bacterium]|nr:hypothetical protein [Clostridia bacterium]